MSSIEITISNARINEMPLLVQLASFAGRNPGLNNSETFYQFEPDGFLMAVDGNKIVGSVSAIGYGQSFGFIGFHLIMPEFQNTGVAEKLLEVAISLLPKRTIGINCAEDQIDFYTPFGFKAAQKILVYKGTANLAMPSLENIISPLAGNFDIIDEFDKRTFPYDRKLFLVRWLNQRDCLTLAKQVNGSYSGYGMYYPVLDGWRISSLIADNYGVAEHLASALIAHINPGSNFYIDLPGNNLNAVRLADSLNMGKTAEYYRMYYGVEPSLAVNNIYSFTNYELG